MNLDGEMEIMFVLNWFKNMLLIESEVNFLMDYMVIEIVIVVVILLIIMIICLVGNVVICYVVFCNRWMWIEMNMFLVNFVIGDIVMVLLLMIILLKIVIIR